MQGRAYRRHHRRRVIKKRLHVIFNVWGYRESVSRLFSNGQWYPYQEQEGKLGKSNLRDCSCFMCQGESYDRAQHKRVAVRILRETEQ